MAENRPIYLDHQSSTPVDPRVRQAMLPWLGETFGNPHSTHHPYGADAASAVAKAQAQLASAIGASAQEIFFTSGATEANNLAIKGAARFARRQQRGKNHLITVATEHPSVLHSMQELAEEGFRLTILPVDAEGRLSIAALEAAICAETLLVSVMAANNEIGTLQPLTEIGALCRSRGVYFHCDAAQALGRIPLDVEAIGVDMLSLSGHKAYAPQGIGALYLRRRPRARVEAMFSGGGQQMGLRAGTVPVALAVAFGEAAEIAAAALPEEASRLAGLRDAFLSRLDGVAYRINGSMTQRMPGNLHLGLPNTDQQELMNALPELALSAGSACNSDGVAASHVMQAIGCPAGAVLRIGFGRFTTEEEMLRAADILTARVKSLAKAA